jgi:pyrroloquinoline quinone biosynthesis protein B
MSARDACTKVQPRTQSSIAVRAEGGDWFLVNASPDVRQQLEPLQQPQNRQTVTIRSNSIAGVLLTDAEIDHTSGLLSLRESDQPLQVYSTGTVWRALTEGLPLFRVLERYCGIEWFALEPNLTTNLGAGLEVEVFSLPTTAPKYMQSNWTNGDWAVGLTFYDRSTGGIFTYAPTFAELTDQMLERFEKSDCILVDGTLWREDEMLSLGVSTSTARSMGHLPLSGPDGSLNFLARLDRPRKVLIHINNTNPILIPGSVERQMLEAAGIEVGYDGLTIDL